MSKRALLAAAVLLLGSCAAAPPPITEIALERNCFGCPSSTELVLRSDGTATFSVIGSARHGTTDIVSRGTVRGGDFDRLARLLVSAGFFSLNDQYVDPQMQDGKWTTIRAVRSGQEKKVFSRNDAAPPAFDQIESAIDEVRRSIAFAPAAGRH